MKQKHCETGRGNNLPLPGVEDFSGYQGCDIGLVIPAVKVLEFKGDDSYLDVGCGLGEASVVAARWGVGFKSGIRRACGVDFNKKTVDNANRLVRVAQAFNSFDEFTAALSQKNTLHLIEAMEQTGWGGEKPGNVEFSVMEPWNLSGFKNGEIRKVSCRHVAHWITDEENRRQMLLELLRVAPVGGQILLSSNSYEYTGHGGRMRKGRVWEEMIHIAGLAGCALKGKYFSHEGVEIIAPVREPHAIGLALFEVADKPKRLI